MYIPSPRRNWPLLSPSQLLPPAPSAAEAQRLNTRGGNSRARTALSPKGQAGSSILGSFLWST